jgi:D-alanine-D-alanine ligase
MKVAVLRGGVGRERQVSLESGRCVAEALVEGGLDVVASDIRPDDLSVLDRSDVDIFFVALHGEFGEDGNLQEVLQERDLVYTGCGPKASRLAFDKVASKRLFAAAGVKVAPSVEFSREQDLQNLDGRLHALGDHLVVKPVRQGSSVGVHVVTGVPEAIDAARKVVAEFGDGMIESFIKGRELTVGILDHSALPIIEIRPKVGFYDYNAKYVDDQTQYLFDTIQESHLRHRIEEAALACFNALGCRDFARVDFILSDDGTPWALEVNTIPGFTTHSLLPKAAGKIGLSMSDLCVRIVRTAFLNRGDK